MQISNNLNISFSFDKTICFWNLNIFQEIKEKDPEYKEKKKKEENKDNKETEENFNNNKIIIELNCIGKINDLKWLTNSILLYPEKNNLYAGSQG